MRARDSKRRLDNITKKALIQKVFRELRNLVQIKIGDLHNQYNYSVIRNRNKRNNVQHFLRNMRLIPPKREDLDMEFMSSDFLRAFSPPKQSPIVTPSLAFCFLSISTDCSWNIFEICVYLVKKKIAIQIIIYSITIITINNYYYIKILNKRQINICVLINIQIFRRMVVFC